MGNFVTVKKRHNHSICELLLLIGLGNFIIAFGLWLRGIIPPFYEFISLVPVLASFYTHRDENVYDEKIRQQFDKFEDLIKEDEA